MSDRHKIDRIVRYLTDDPIYQIHSFNIDLRANHIYLVGSDDYATDASGSSPDEPGVEYSMASKFIKNLNILMRKSNSPILIHMKTCGGNWNEGMAIYDAIKSCPNIVTILNYTHARSMSSIIFQAADKRVMMPNSIFMFHEGDIQFSGTIKQYRSEFQEDERQVEKMLEIYTNVMKMGGCMSSKTSAQIRRWLIDKMNKKENVFLTATQAVEYGFADEVFGSDGNYDWKKLIDA